MGKKIAVEKREACHKTPRDALLRTSFGANALFRLEASDPTFTSACNSKILSY